MPKPRHFRTLTGRIKAEVWLDDTQQLGSQRRLVALLDAIAITVLRALPLQAFATPSPRRGYITSRRDGSSSELNARISIFAPFEIIPRFLACWLVPAWPGVAETGAVFVSISVIGGGGGSGGV